LKAYYICTAELFLGDIEHVRELIPHHHVGLDKNCTWLGRVFIDEPLRLWTQGKVGDYDVTVLL
jgi:hypothetical protein